MMQYVGILLFTAGFVVFVLGLSWGGTVYPWKSAAVIASVVGGFLVLCVFVLWECYAPLKEPFIPMHLFRSGRWVASVVLLGLGAGVYYAFAIIVPMQAAVLYSNGDIMITGGISVIVGIGIISGQIVGVGKQLLITTACANAEQGALATRIGKTKYQCMAVFTIGGAFLAAAAVVSPDNMGTEIALILLGCIFIGWNETICLANSTILVHDQNEIGVAGGVAGSVRAGICGELSLRPSHPSSSQPKCFHIG